MHILSSSNFDPLRSFMHCYRICSQYRSKRGWENQEHADMSETYGMCDMDSTLPHLISLGLVRSTVLHESSSTSFALYKNHFCKEPSSRRPKI